MIGIVPGGLGCFGGMGVVAGLCTRLVVTHEARIGLNGPEVIEAEHGLAEIDSRDTTTVWATTGGRQRFETGLADALVIDDRRGSPRRRCVGDRGGRPSSSSVR